MSQPDLAYFDPGDGRRIAIRHRVAADPARPTLVFLPGYASDMTGSKSGALDAFAGATGCGCLRLDYSGTGASGGEFADGTLARWLDEVVAAIERLVDGRVILIGSSMGGWIALLAALRLGNRVSALVGIAAAPDFTDWGFSPEDKIKLLQDGKLERPDPDSNTPFVNIAASGSRAKRCASSAARSRSTVPSACSTASMTRSSRSASH